MWSSAGDRFRVLRHRLRLTQSDLSAVAGVSRRLIGLIENGRWERVPFGALNRVANALGARLYPNLSWQGEQLDRLVDAGHADLQNTFATMLRSLGWLVAIEVSFNHYGERGRYDLLAFHPATGIVLVVEIKTAVGDVQATLGILDVKVRLALDVARQQGWAEPRIAIPALVIADERQQHRVLQQHAALFSHFSLRGRPARAWLRAPSTGPSGLLLWVPMTYVSVVGVREASRGWRVRNQASPRKSELEPARLSSLEQPSQS